MRKTVLGVAGLLAATVIGISEVLAATETSLTSAGQKLEAQYTAQFKALQAEIGKAVPSVNEQSKAAFLKACETVRTAEAEANAAKQPLGKTAGGAALVDHAKGKRIGGAEMGTAGGTGDASLHYTFVRHVFQNCLKA